METTFDNQVAVIDRSIEIFRSAPDILKANQERSVKAVAVGNSILEQWETAWAIEKEEEKMKALAAADERSNKYLANCSTALVSEKDARAAITQMMDAFKTMFTTAENDIDKAKKNSVPAKVQEQRNDYVKEVSRIKEEKRLAAEKAAAKAKEAIEIRADAEKKTAADFSSWLLAKKTKMTNAFNAITLENFKTKEDNLRSYQPGFEFQTDYSGFSYYPQHTKEQVTEIQNEAFANVVTDYSNTTFAELTLLRDELIEQLPSKKAELLEAKRLADEAEAERKEAEEAEAKRQAAIAKANAAEKAKLEAEAAEQRRKDAERQEEIRRQQEKAEAERKEREATEAKRLADEAEAARAKAEQDAEIKKQGEQTMVMFEQEAAIADSTPAPETRQGYDILILHPVGYTQIFALWFENEGKNLPVDKIGNTKLDQMKAWAEKHAHKTGTKIESKFLNYEVSVKAVTRKAK